MVWSKRHLLTVSCGKFCHYFTSVHYLKKALQEQVKRGFNERVLHSLLTFTATNNRLQEQVRRTPFQIIFRTGRWGDPALKTLFGGGDHPVTCAKQKDVGPVVLSLWRTEEGLRDAGFEPIKILGLDGIWPCLVEKKLGKVTVPIPVARFVYLC